MHAGQRVDHAPSVRNGLFSVEGCLSVCTKVHMVLYHTHPADSRGTDMGTHVGWNPCCRKALCRLHKNKSMQMRKLLGHDLLVSKMLRR